MSVSISEMEPGIVVYASTESLIAFGGCRTIVKAQYQSAGEHFFLIVAVDRIDATCLCTPLHRVGSNHVTNDRILIDEGLKEGKAEGWTDDGTYYFKWNFWRVPLAALEIASASDDSDGDRRFYARRDTKALAWVKKDLHRAREPWREV